MKRLFLLLTVLLLLPVQFSWASTDLGLVTTSDNLRFPVIALDDTGKVARPDSGHIMVWFEGEATVNSTSYSSRWPTAGATSTVIDSLQLGGTDYWYFFDLVGDIDNDEGEGNYTGTVVMWTDGQPTFNNFSFTLYDTESEALWDEIAWTLDSLQNQDNWIATAAELAKALDSMAKVIDSLENYDNWIAKEATIQIVDDSIDAWDDNIAEILDILDTLQNQDDWVAKEATIQIIDDSIDVYDTRLDSLLAAASDAKLEKVWHDIDTTNIDTSEIGEWLSTGISASLSDANMGGIADSVWDKAYADMIAVGGGAGDSVWAILNDLLDSLQVYDTRFDSILAALADANIGDKVWVDGSPATRGEINDILDTLQNQDDWIATAANLTKAIDSINAILDSIQIPLNVNVASVDADAIGVGDLATGAIDADAISANAIGASEIAADAIGASEIAVNAIGELELAASAANEIANACIDSTAVYGAVEQLAADSGIVRYSLSDSILELRALHIRTTTGNDTAFIATGTGGGHGVFVQGGATGSGLYADAGHVIAGATGYGILARGKGDGKAGMCLYGDSGNVHGFYLLAHGTGNDILLHGSKNIKGFIDSAKYIAVVGEARLTDAVWEYDTANISGAQAVGTMLKDTSSYQGSASGLDSGAVYGAVAQANEDSSIALQPSEWSAADSGAYQGSAAGLDSTAVYGAVEQLMADSGIVRYSLSGSILRLAGLQIISPTDADTAAVFIKQLDSSKNAFHVIAVGGGKGLYITSTTGGTAVEFHAIGTGADFVVDSSIMTRIVGTIDSVNYVKAGGYGRGSRTITHYLIDTAGTDTALAGVQIDVKYLSGKRYIELKTNSSGYIEFAATENDTLLYWINSQPWHIFPNAAGGDSTFVTTGADITDSSWGYDAEITTPSGDSTCVCYLYAYDAGNNPEKGVVLVAQLLGNNIQDTCTNTVISNKVITGTASDATGYCSVEVTWTACLLNCDKVKFGLKRGSTTDWKHSVAVPSQTTWRITRE